MNFIRFVIQKPVTVAVGVILIAMAGLVSLKRIPIQLTPDVDDTIIAVTTRWEGTSPEEIEREIVEKQEEKLQGLTNLRAMTSESQQGVGTIRLEFTVGTNKDVALREVSDKLRQVAQYPMNANEPVIEASDPDNKDYITWIIFGTTDEHFDPRTLNDFAEDHVKPVLERVSGVSEVNVLGGFERETQIRFDPNRLAQFGITPSQFVAAIQDTNRNISGGELRDSKFNVRLRTVSQYEGIDQIERTVITYTDAGPVYVGDVAEAVEWFKEPRTFVRSKGRSVLAINAQREVGANVMQVMAGVREAIDRLNTKGGVLDTKAQSLGLNGDLTLKQVYDQTVYIDDALGLIRSNIWLGGSIAILVLLLFLRSIRPVTIIALAIPISVIGAVVAMVAMGRSINVVSLAGMAFAIGMVVDNAIVVQENIFRHLEMGKSPMRAAYDGTREVWGAVLASTLTTVFVFVPILLIEEEAGQLFRDIALAICAAVILSLLVSITVIPTSAARIMRGMKQRASSQTTGRNRSVVMRIVLAPVALVRSIGRILHAIPDVIAGLIYKLCGSVLLRVLVVLVLTAVSLAGSYFLMPPADYLPTGNRNLVFGLLIPPPGYNLEQQEELGVRIERTIQPFWEIAESKVGTPEYEARRAKLQRVRPFNWMTGELGDPLTPPGITNYFVVGLEGTMFHGGISDQPTKVVDLIPLFAEATKAETLPGVMAFAFQVPLFRLGGSTGSAIKINFAGDDLGKVSDAATLVLGDLVRKYGGHTVQPSPSNYNIYGPELQLLPRKRYLADLGLTPADLGLFAQAMGDGAIIGEYRMGSDTVDLKVVARDAVDRVNIVGLEDTPVATPTGHIVPLSSLAEFAWVNSPPQINHVGRQRSVTLLFTPPQGTALEAAVEDVDAILAGYRESGQIGAEVATNFSGSASKLRSVMTALLGDGTVLGLLQSSLFLALMVVYLLMCALFQSFLRPLIIMFSVPLATLGGFLALFGVFIWSATDRYMPMQMLDVLTMLGFIILIGIVVNNAILIVHQSINFMKGDPEASDELHEPMEPRRAIAESVRSRLRPIFMSTLTSVGGMLPLVLMPGSGSELYRGLGAVVVGGLTVSTIFTILLVPLLLSLVTDAQRALGRLPEARVIEERGRLEQQPATGGTGGSRGRVRGGVLASAPSRSPDG